jgi:hypothetical protein
MENLGHLIRLFTFLAGIVFFLLSARAQTSADIYGSLEAHPSTIHWDDPAHIIGGSCKVYRDCLSNLSLDEIVDRNRLPSLASEQVDSVRKCHQALFNAARANPQVKPSAATQAWLQHSIYPGTEAKSFAVPSNFGDPR